MKVGDLIRLPQNHGYGLVMKIVNSKPGSRASSSVMVIQSWGEDWWDADACMVMNESR
jgi:hypothetical protein|tara:strand:- start:257 stop:430 length:174 start_codon:yes stop_codon:yes gene_type:complete